MTKPYRVAEPGVEPGLGDYEPPVLPYTTPREYYNRLVRQDKYQPYLWLRKVGVIDGTNKGRQAPIAILAL